MNKIIIETNEEISDYILNLISDILTKNKIKCNFSLYNKLNRTEFKSIYD
jgi:hypothetical protein